MLLVSSFWFYKRETGSSELYLNNFRKVALLARQRNKRKNRETAYLWYAFMQSLHPWSGSVPWCPHQRKMLERTNHVRFTLYQTLLFSKMHKVFIFVCLFIYYHCHYNYYYNYTVGTVLQMEPGALCFSPSASPVSCSPNYTGSFLLLLFSSIGFRFLVPSHLLASSVFVCVCVSSLTRLCKTVLVKLLYTYCSGKTAIHILFW